MRFILRLTNYFTLIVENTLIKKIEENRRNENVKDK